MLKGVGAEGPRIETQDPSARYMTEGLALPEGHDRVVAPPVVVPVAEDVRSLGVPVEDRHAAAGVDNQAGRQEAWHRLVVDPREHLSVQSHQPVDFQTGQALVRELLTHLSDDDTVLGIPETTEVEERDTQLGLLALLRLATLMVLHRPVVLADVVGEGHPELAQLVLQNLLDDLAITLETIPESERDTSGLVRTGMVRQHQTTDLLLGESESEPLIPVTELVRVLADRRPVDGLRRRREEYPECRTVDLRQKVSIVSQYLEQVPVCQHVLHALGTRLAKLFVQLRHLRK